MRVSRKSILTPQQDVFKDWKSAQVAGTLLHHAIGLSGTAMIYHATLTKPAKHGLQRERPISNAEGAARLTSLCDRRPEELARSDSA
jgi:hypothetical protein